MSQSIAALLWQIVISEPLASCSRLLPLTSCLLQAPHAEPFLSRFVFASIFGQFENNESIASNRRENIGSIVLKNIFMLSVLTNSRANRQDGFLEETAGRAKVASGPSGGGERLQEVLRRRNPRRGAVVCSHS